MSTPVNKSQPRYRPLEPDLGGRYHLLLGHGSGGDALLRLIGGLPPDTRIHVIYAAESPHERDWSDELRRTGRGRISIVRTSAEAFAELNDVLS
ncbi:MAG TPA: hypothetical protein VGH74_20225, partial [Planctomycetaceae bacterium]